ncbi:hypothetical protein [Wolbachia endosymbiont of Drosophila pseudotakahashii]|uniref:hypothetical protein n=1 Tax=Wolbachia endosymbiont of Drosophila pseudotakahashii TaxID=375919 RepID=UPI00222F4F03|nr:hypothetical protein [Wolbachia endosymbiont of Drosophila pseudotakahashii]UZE38334.1 hypothetical protein ONI09_05565 [Wolbachia endosymbiont of Drosophila pseudotakahashii]
MSGSQQPPSPVIQVAPYGVIPVPRHWDPGKLIVHYSNIFDQKLDSSGLCCIASYDGLKIKKMENISSLLFWYL